MKIKKYVVIIFFIITIIALLLPCFGILGYNWDFLQYRNQNPDIANGIAISSILIVPFLLMIFVKLYKKYEVHINEKILFAISVIPFLWGIGRWIKHDGYIVWRWILNPYQDRLSVFIHGHYLAISIWGNLELAGFAVLTGILFFVISNLKKENKIKYADFLAFNFVFVGIYHTMHNLICFHINTNVDKDLDFYEPLLNHYDMMMKIVELPAPLYFGIIFALITAINYFLRKYFSKAKSYKDKI